jgi:hypothetical protein
MVDEDFWVANRPIKALAVSGNTIYIGGFFSSVGPAAVAPSR